MVRASCFQNAYFLSEKFFLLYIVSIIQINGGFVKIYLNLCLCFFFYSSKRSKNRCAHTRHSASASMFSALIRAPRLRQKSAASGNGSAKQRKDAYFRAFCLFLAKGALFVAVCRRIKRFYDVFLEIVAYTTQYYC